MSTHCVRFREQKTNARALMQAHAVEAYTPKLNSGEVENTARSEFVTVTAL